jgi:hypothetical protein
MIKNVAWWNEKAGSGQIGFVQKVGINMRQGEESEPKGEERSGIPLLMTD